MTKKFKRVLSDDWLPLEFQSGNSVPVTSVLVNRKTLKSIVEQTEQAVLAKLAEQEPVAWRVHPFDYGVGVDGAYAITQQEDQMQAWIRKGWDVTPLYAHPMPSSQVNLDSSNHIADMRKMVPEYAEVYVGDGLFAICDWQDWDSIKSYKWSLSTRGRSGCLYAQTKIGNSDGTRSRLAMHHVILPQKEGFVVDHINGNGLDNRRDNLRYATIQQNSFNQKIRKASSIYKGVSFDKESGLWRASIGVNGKKVYGGRHETELEAAKAYDEMAKKYFGEFAVLNLASAASIAAAPKYTGDK